MNAKELLRSRFEVIATYPFCKFELGQIIDSTKEIKTEVDVAKVLDYYKYNYEAYPHLFRKLNWWENRKVAEMPTKLKSLVNKDSDDFDLEKEEVFLIISWDMKNKYGFLNGLKNEVCDLEIFAPEYGYIPVD